MKKIALFIIACLSLNIAMCQDAKPAKPSKKIDLSNRAGDHFMLQLSSDHWTNMPDSVSSHQSGFSRGFNAYVMFDKPFKNSPKLSIAVGVGISSSNIFFKKMDIDIKSTANSLPFINEDSLNHFKKYKISMSYLEIPVEFRFSSNPLHNSKSVKVAIGAKVGTMINAHAKGKTLQDKYNNTIDSYTDKEVSKRFFNTTRLAATARIGYGIYSIFGAYQLSKVFKDLVAPPIKSFQVGLTISGL